MRKLVSGCLSAAFAAIAILPALTHAQVVPVSGTPQIGSSNPATAAPPVPRPSTQPCVVQLFNNLAFEDYTPKTFNYAPPSNCPGPWAKVVFTADFTVSAGIQYDRTAAFYLGSATNRANIYYGTTAEPSPTLSPSWHVERDVTDLSALFNSDQIGEANIGNTYNSTYNGIIYASAALEFYPASYRDPAPRVPDMVVPVNGSGGDAGTLNTTSDQITQTLNLPMNVERVYVDVIAQSQIGDEFWYSCVPSNQATDLFTCGNTAFRETEISIDGKPAGVAPVYPWIFTGGFDPYLWFPIPGVQTLDFKPFRVDLTPFAGVLSDGNPHTVAVSVFNANGYFLATANVLVYTDHGSQRVTGGILSNTLSAAPHPAIQDNISYNSSNGQYTGSIDTSSVRNFAISGYINTSHGRVDTTVSENVNFTNNQQFDVNPVLGNIDDQNIQQNTIVDEETVTHGGPLETRTQEQFTYPLNLDYTYAVNSDGSAAQTVNVNQQYLLTTKDHVNGSAVYTSNLTDQVQSKDTLIFNTNGSYGPQNPTSSSTYTFNNSKGACYSRTITSANNVLTGVTNGQGCGKSH